jgi:inhibitor of KinA
MRRSLQDRESDTESRWRSRIAEALRTAAEGAEDGARRNTVGDFEDCTRVSARWARGYNRAHMKTASASSVRFVKASDQALLIYFDEASMLAAHQHVAALLGWLEAEPVPGVRNLHPAFKSLLVKFDPWRWRHEELETELRARLENVGRAGVGEPRVVEIPVCYGEEFGPDLEDVARMRGMTAADVVERHAKETYVVFFLGFVPGFAYMGGLPDALVTPRLATPRRAVRAGSVGIAGRQTGVYPFATPGGWRLLGCTPLKMFQPERAGMCLVKLGDRVKFLPISRERFGELESA